MNIFSNQLKTDLKDNILLKLFYKMNFIRLVEYKLADEKKKEKLSDQYIYVLARRQFL